MNHFYWAHVHGAHGPVVLVVIGTMALIVALAVSSLWRDK